MEPSQIQSLTVTFEGHAQTTENGVEFWLARDLQFLLGYAKWDNFLNVITKAKTSCEVAGHTVADHFADVGKMVDICSGSGREIGYLIAQHADPTKQVIDVAGCIFSILTHQFKVIENRSLKFATITVRRELTNNEKQHFNTINDWIDNHHNFTLVSSKRDHALLIRICKP